MVEVRAPTAEAGAHRSAGEIDMKTIFISYRREDAEGHAGRLFEDLVAHFGRGSVFLDVAGVEPGVDFRKAIDNHVAQCGVLLAVIGKSWLTATDPSGQRRIDSSNDFVRLETLSALKRDIPVIPVLVHGAKMPREEELPKELSELAFRNNVELSHARWDSDVQLLIQALERLLPERAPRAQAAVPSAPSTPPAPAGSVAAPSPAPTSETRSLVKPVAAVLAVVLLAVVGYFGFRAYDQARSAAAAASVAAAEAAAAADRAASASLAQQQEAARDAAAKAQAAQEAEQARLAAERAAEATRKALQEQTAEADRKAQAEQKAEADRQAAMNAEAERRAIAAKKAENDRLLAQKAEAERVAMAARQAEADRQRLAAKKAAEARDPRNLQGFGTDGRRVVEVTYSDAANNRNGRFSAVQPGQWQEINAVGTLFRFRELGRDDWSVYLWDDSRQVGIQLDLHTRRVNYRPNDKAPYSLLYPIVMAK
jgi:hypothetical protein